MKKTLKDLILEGGKQSHIFNAFSAQEKQMAARRLAAIKADDDISIYIKKLKKEKAELLDTQNEKQSAKKVGSRKA